MLKVTESQLHLKYDEISLPKRGDVVIIEFDFEQGFEKENLQTISRGKSMPKEVLLSNLVAADGKHPKVFATQQKSWVKHI